MAGMTQASLWGSVALWHVARAHSSSKRNSRVVPCCQEILISSACRLPANRPLPG
jgi:hypothetical protein